MNIFISWSKKHSQETAEALKAFMYTFFNNRLTLWVSSLDIEIGSRNMVAIKDALMDSDMGIFCLNSSNYQAPWMLFEAGVISAKEVDNKNTVYPILFGGLKKKELSESPLNQFQMITFEKAKFKKMMKELHDKLDPPVYEKNDLFDQYFNTNWKILLVNINKIYHKMIGGERALNKESAIEAFEQKQFPRPHLGKVVLYESGFERQLFYEVLLNNVSNRLWIFGRKNRKLFSQENQGFFRKITARKSNKLDLRILFLDSNSDKTILSNAQQKSNFKNILKACLIDAAATLNENGINPSSVCKTYQFVRSDHIFVVDNVVIFSKICYDEYDKPQHLTNASFKVVEASDEIGLYYMTKFENAWKSANPLNVKNIN